MAMVPRDHISTFGPYSLRATISGAIQYGKLSIVVHHHQITICIFQPGFFFLTNCLIHYSAPVVQYHT